ncbi:conserved hypothetical protein [Planktothrix serta PCC 8927]|uniref:Uncharacterized protein n=1 Tax=Planktothrix serta PCC 8927 TaxID=671068 RepID=A0A7Z9BTN7_9CYAN|nr:hypothetical protein [Planktothrix serta]VXD18934.1 conserved hypothetical protein [Planktothrix serta PCC 8927]
MNNQKAWLNESVQDFFSNLNWLGTPSRVQSGDPAPSKMNLTLSVADFFQRIDWEGVPQVGVMPVISDSSASDDSNELDVTIDDLMGLF